MPEICHYRLAVPHRVDSVRHIIHIIIIIFSPVCMWQLTVAGTTYRMDHILVICPCKQTSGMIQNFGYFGLSCSVTQYFIGGSRNKT
jgi:hypothetical protein